MPKKKRTISKRSSSVQTSSRMPVGMMIVLILQIIIVIMGLWGLKDAEVARPFFSMTLSGPFLYGVNVLFLIAAGISAYAIYKRLKWGASFFINANIVSLVYGTLLILGYDLSEMATRVVLSISIIVIYLITVPQILYVRKHQDYFNKS